ncbi:MAG: adenylate kinase [Candidatus Buchananbacteria bacterium RIFCSPHIGHO2_01_FULL_47_11b]|uniref:Adenylate kinase n=1 Tax=Candidatus Buchananbacteria bacterium RIFCSPHIGHO2_01_FULL_47_11b TaxID=1797537 RepID=A0A1G1Y2V0_9BACT|nr:MAG: adenylate kinase [Candidatus Buchananbacteria bacterium RIFCSPHIGHO2_01_FULL_47_11b]
MHIIIFGPQGSGKGTQAELIARRYGYAYISTGDIFRYHIKNNTPLGSQVVAYTTAGHLVPDELTNQIVQDRLQQPDCAKGFVLDGYPRNQAQLDFIKTIVSINYAIQIDLSDDEAIRRLSGRWACKCGLSYHDIHNPPKQVGRCNICGGQLFKREDDQPAAIKKRLEIYHHQTEPLVAEYKTLGILQTVNGAQSIEEVFEQIKQVLKQ